MTDKLGIGSKIRYERKKAGLTQTQLAAKIGVSESRISQYERGMENPRVCTLLKIADAIGVPYHSWGPDAPEKNLSDERLTVGKNLQMERRKAGLTQKALSDLSGIPVITIQGYEAEKFTPKYSAIQKLCAAMNIPRSSLLPDIYDLSNYSTLELIQELERREKERL